MMLYLLTCLLYFNTITTIHPIHISNSEIIYNNKNQSLEIITKVFTDDFTTVVDKYNNVKTHLITDKEHPQANKYIVAYLKEQFQVEVNGTFQKITFIGREEDPDDRYAMLIYLEIENVPIPKTIEVKDAILKELFDDQTNIIYCEVDKVVKEEWLKDRKVRTEKMSF